MKKGYYFDDERGEVFNDELQNWNMYIIPSKSKIEAVTYEEAIEIAIAMIKENPEDFIEVE
jgi:hypothetical protein